MKTTLIAAVSTDGFIASLNGDTTWTSPSDKLLLHDAVLKADTLIMGMVTYQKHTMQKTNDSKLRIVLTHKPKSSKSLTKNTRFINASLPEVIKTLKSEGYKNILILGGSSVYKQAMQAQVANTLLLTVEPIKLNTGIPFYDIPFTGNYDGYRLSNKISPNTTGTLLYTYSKSP